MENPTGIAIFSVCSELLRNFFFGEIVVKTHAIEDRNKIFCKSIAVAVDNHLVWGTYVEERPENLAQNEQRFPPVTSARNPARNDKKLFAIPFV